MPSQPKVLIIGASGLLGRCIYDQFSQDPNFHTVGTASKRTRDNLLQLDLLNFENISKIFNTVSPQFVIYCAAQKDPDIAERERDMTLCLNAISVKLLAELCAVSAAPLFYISTDYVFDGTKPPYSPSSKTTPMGYYGKSKCVGEKYTLQYQNNCVLRLPFLYGPVEYPGESWLTSLINPLLRSEAICCDHWALRFPTYTYDVADVCYQMIKSIHKGIRVSGIYHWSGSECYTKYEMALGLASALNVKHHRITPNLPTSEPSNRPYNCRLDCSTLQMLNIGTSTPFEGGLRKILLASNI
ncbi:MAG: NAD(P)-dependent oxidoreductase [Gammaproteobacteria bacterium]|jgi:dTDP-4-dehydrorhamnose reductase|nr:NAD(P)-dependent oxidoreductase [Gammaproteobacteria bacterium]